MLQRIHQTVSHTSSYLRREGPRRLTLRFLREIPFRLKRVRYHWLRSKLTGRLVELRGNTWMLDGLRFSLDNPAIDISTKGRFFRGTYEDDGRTMVRRHIIRELPVIEGGGSIGVTSCIINRLLQDPTAHLVLEPNPALLPTLEKNCDQNGCKFQILHAALDEHGPTATFHLHKKCIGGSVQRVTGSPITVPAVTVGGLLAKTGWKKISLVLDIEGGEIDLINEESQILRDHVAALIVEMHPFISGSLVVAASLQKLEHLGFTLRDQRGHVFAFHARESLHCTME